VVSTTLPAAETVPVKIYQVGTIAPSSYTVIDRLWVGRWRTAFDVPSHADAAAATRELLEEAARIGGEGVVNLHCLARADGASHYCYGNVIKLK
jgi:hypothetical protein